MRGTGKLATSCRYVAIFAVLLAVPNIAVAHSTEGAFVLLLPTGFYLLGGTMAVAASFILLSLTSIEGLQQLAAARLRICVPPRLNPLWTSGLAAVLLIVLLLAGFFGNRDPLLNPLPLTVWTLWWVLLVLLQAVFGDLWRFLNPWSALYRLILVVIGRHRWRTAPPCPYPSWLGYWPAVLGFLAFAWFELIYPAPADPAQLAIAVLVYSGVTLCGMLLFGETAWLAQAEGFSVFFRLIAGLSPLRVEKDTASEHSYLCLTMPGRGLLDITPMPLSGVAFVLLALSAVSFDGLSRTFWWLAKGGINPLDFPGRSAVMGFMSIGLVGMWAVLMGCYLAAIRFGMALGDTSRTDGFRRRASALVVSILPISLGYHIAHYLTELLVNIQDVRVALSDPFGRGWDLFGTRDAHVTTWFLSDYQAVRLIWNAQAAAIVLGHILAVAVAHLIVARNASHGRTALLQELPLAALMVAYTLFGLWLLATPSAG